MSGRPSTSPIGGQTSMRRRTFLAATLAAAASAGSACGFSNGSGGSTPESGSAESNEPKRGGTLRQTMMPVTHLDPAVAGNASFGQILMVGLWEGLVVVNADDPSKVLPGAAESWDISNDGLIYTFHVRENAKWSNGQAVTASDFEWNWKRILTPGVAGEGNPSFNPGRVNVAGAADYMSGENGNFADVGAKALDDLTFELRLDAPNSDLLIYLSQFWALPLHPATVEENGEEWLNPQIWVGNGPYILDEFRVNQGAVLLSNDQYWDSENYYISRWEVSFNDGGTTFDLLSYQQNEIDITGRIEDDLEAVTTSDVADEIASSPTNQFRNLTVFNSRHPALHDVRVRQALSLAIDREALGEISKPAIPGNSLIPEGVESSEEIPGVEHDVDAARELLSDAGYADGDGMPVINLVHHQNIPWVEAIAEMWREDLGIDARLDVLERGVYLEKLKVLLHPEDYVGFFVFNNSVQPPTLLGAAHSSVGSSARTYGVNLAPVEVAEELDIARSQGATDIELAQILKGRRHPEVEHVSDLAERAIREEDPEAQHRLAVESAVAKDEAYVSIPVLWGGYYLLINPRVNNLKLWHHTTVFTTRGVWLDR
ncbi:peptide ABC transporter substrate-binding protein [Phytoactinopolyspora endophytica]|uniref:peptide ABC transporter substrate-binding protein n=1 Tax=Phytoactinopolyspora endophytica TaxID=1642495 RepID=UPI00101D6D16|nr:peptide ABC transporter substrate-binding protein [Phytoactinopolyspora endophytica]